MPPISSPEPRHGACAGLTRSNQQLRTSSPPAVCPLPTPPRTPIPAPTVLDHAAYPHIFDIILQHAPPLSLLALRAASRSLRDRADALLAHHVLYTEDARTPDSTVRFAPLDRRFAQTRILDLFISEAAQKGHDLGHRPCYGCEARQREDAVEALLRAAPLFTALDAVRFRGALDLEWAEMNSLMQALRTKWAVYLTDSMYSGLPRLPVVLSGARVALPIDLRRTGFGITLPPLKCFTGDVYLYLVLPDTPVAVDKTQREATHACLEDVCSDIADIIFAWRPLATYTFIAVESWDERWFVPSLKRRQAAPDDLYYDPTPRLGGADNLLSMQAKLRDTRVGSAHQHTDPSRRDRCVQEYVRFLSLDEFRARAGDDVARLIINSAGVSIGR